MNVPNWFYIDKFFLSVINFQKSKNSSILNISIFSDLKKSKFLKIIESVLKKQKNKWIKN